MTEAEYLQAIFYARELSASDLMDFITTFFAFVVMSHFFGRQLSRAMAVIASLVYSSFAAITVFSLVDLIIMQGNLGRELHATYPASRQYLDGYENPEAFGIAITLTPMILGWLVSLYYMHFYVRRDIQEPDDSQDTPNP